MTELRKGDLVRYSPLGMELLGCRGQRQGVIVSNPRHSLWGVLVRVLWSDRKASQSYNTTFLERVPNDELLPPEVEITP